MSDAAAIDRTIRHIEDHLEVDGQLIATRKFDVRIVAAPATGFLLYRGAEIFAAYSTAEDLLTALDAILSDLPGEEPQRRETVPARPPAKRGALW